MTDKVAIELTADARGVEAGMQQAATAVEKSARQQRQYLEFARLAAKEYEKSIKSAATASGEMENAATSATRTSHATAGITRELIVLGHEASQGSWKRLGGSLMVLAEYSGNAQAAIRGLAGPLGLAVGALAALGTAIVAGAKESIELNRALQLSGNYAGITAGHFTEMARSIAESTRTGVNSARTALEELTKSGKFGPAMMEPVATAIVRIEKLSGESAQSIVQDFARMDDGVAKWAEEHNKAWHFMTVAQYEYIRSLEENGKQEQAQIETMKLVNEHVKDLKQNLGYAERAWNAVAHAASLAWDAMKGVGRDSTPEDEIAKITEKIATLRRQLKQAGPQSVTGGFLQVQIDNEEAQKSVWLHAQMRQQERVSMAAYEKGLQERGIASSKYFHDEAEKLKTTSKLEMDLAALHTAIRDRVNAGGASHLPIDDELERNIRLRDRSKGARSDESAAKKLEDSFQARVRSLTEEGIKLDAETASWANYGKSIDKARVATLEWALAHDPSLKGLSKPKADQLRALATSDDQKDKELADTRATRAIQDKIKAMTEESTAREVSARQAYIAKALDDKNLISLGKETEAYKTLAKALADAAGKKFDATVAGPSMDAFSRKAESIAQKVNLETAALGQSALAMQKARDQAELLQAAKEEIAKNPEREAEVWERYTKALLDAIAARDKFNNVSRSSETGINKAMTEFSDSATNQANNAKTMFNGVVKNMEDALVNFAKTGKLSFSSLFSFMAEEFLRQQIRMSMAGAIGGSFSFASMLGTVGTFFGFPHANGLDRVPYDGYPAVLHQGERVLTKQAAIASDNTQARSSIDMSVTIGSVGSGVSRAEMFAAVSQANGMQEQRIRRLQREGVL